MTFSVGSPGSNDVIQAAGQSITVPAGTYSSIDMLATAVRGNQPNQTFTINYTTGSPTTVTQSISDWYTPQGYTGESPAVTMAYRNTSSGGADNRTFYVYGYSLPVDSTRTVTSITLPDNDQVEVLSMAALAAVNAPTALTAAAGTGSQVNLSWTAPTSGTVTGFNVYRGTSAGGESTTPLNATPLPAGTSAYADATALPGNTYFYTIKALDGPAASAASNEASLAVAASGTTAQVDLSSSYNRQGIAADGTQFGPSVDGVGSDLSGALLGTSQTVGGVAFGIGPAGANDVVQATGQTISLPAGQYSKLEVLAFGVDGNQPNQTFTVNYTTGARRQSVKASAIGIRRSPTRASRRQFRCRTAIRRPAESTIAISTSTATRSRSTIPGRSTASLCPTTVTSSFWR